MSKTREESPKDAAAEAAGAPRWEPGWEEVARGPVTLRLEPMERSLPPAPGADDEPKPKPAMRVETALMERPAPREDAAEARKAGERPNIAKRFELMERRVGARRGPPPSIGSMDPSRRA